MITEDKLKHSLSVAQKCQALATDAELNQEQQNACFVMGFLHDIGYRDVADMSKISEHPDYGYRIIRDFLNYKDNCIDAIDGHGKYPSSNIWSYILNMADMTIDHTGKEVSIEDRLKSIKERYGEESSQYQNAQKTAVFLDTHQYLFKRRELTCLTFVLNKSDEEKLEFQFYPELSDSLYEDYFWEIVHYDRNQENAEWENRHVLFSFFEECSAIPDVCEYLKAIASIKESKSIFSIGNGDWDIEYIKTVEYALVRFVIFDYDTGKGVRFTVSEQKAVEFGEFLNEIIEYMREHYGFEQMLMDENGEI